MCNFCKMQLIRKHAKEEKKIVTYESGDMGGVDVFVHPKEVKISIRDNPVQRGKYFVAWFMELPERCCC